MLALACGIQNAGPGGATAGQSFGGIAGGLLGGGGSREDDIGFDLTGLIVDLEMDPKVDKDAEKILARIDEAKGRLRKIDDANAKVEE